MVLRVVAVMFISAVVSKTLLRSMIIMLSNSKRENVFARNYRGKAIPAIGGIVFIPALIVTIFLLLFILPENYRIYMSFLTVAICMGFAGIVDDLIGDGTIRGFASHAQSAVKGNFTTGFLKAFTGFGISCIVSFDISKSYSEFVLNAFVIALSANTLNLFDTRPGRAVKVFLTAAVLLFTNIMGRYMEVLPLIMLCATACFYIKYDLKEVCMLGDTGANILGISLGYYCALMLGDKPKLMLFAVLAAINIISERLSFSELVQKSRLLKFLDDLGRRETGSD